MNFELSELKHALTSKKLITAKAWDDLLAEAKEKKQEITDLLIEKKVLDEESLTELVASQINVKYTNLQDIEQIPKDTLLLVPEPIARRHGVVAFAKDKNKLSLGMTDPDDLATRDALKKKTDLEIVPLFSLCLRVARTGFEPVIWSLRTTRPGPTRRTRLELYFTPN